MPTPLTPPNLRAALSSAALDHRYWSSPEARLILDHALNDLRPIALRLNADPADALSHAFEAWMGMSAQTRSDETIDLWAYTRTAVRRSLDREDEANRRGTSVAALRRSGVRDTDITTGTDGIDIGYEHVGVDQPAPAAIDPRATRARAAVEQVLTLAGLTDEQCTILLDVFADLASTSPSWRAAIDRALTVRDVISTETTDAQWRTLVEVILGTPAGLPGVMALAGAGHPAPAMEPHISTRLMSLLTSAA